MIEANLLREAVNLAVDGLIALGVQDEGTISLLPLTTWVSRRALAAEERAPGASADAVVWTDVIERAYDESELTWTFMKPSWCSPPFSRPSRWPPTR